jgi:hypothetical protein
MIFDKKVINDVTMEIVAASIGAVSAEFEAALGLESGVMLIVWPTEDALAPEAERIGAQGMACSVGDIPTMVKVLKHALAKLEKRL